MGRINSDYGPSTISLETIRDLASTEFGGLSESTLGARITTHEVGHQLLKSALTGDGDVPEDGIHTDSTDNIMASRFRSSVPDDEFYFYKTSDCDYAASSGGATIVFLAISAIALSAPVPDPFALRLTAEVVGHSPLPGQAVRVRLTVANAGRAPTGPLPPIDGGLVVPTEIRPPGGLFVSASGARVLRSLYPAPTQVGWGPAGPNTGPVSLPPGGRQSVSLAVGVERVGDKEFAVRPLFPEPGEYALKFRYTYGQRPSPNPRPNAPVSLDPLFVEAEVTVAVGRPGPGDRPWVDALTDRGLAAVLMTPNAPCSAAQAAAIRRLLERAPESSYTDYGRLAVARFHMDGPGDPAVSRRVNAALAADHLAGIYRWPYFPFKPHVRLRLAKVDIESYRVLERPDKSIAGLSLLGDDVEWIDFYRPRLSADEWATFRTPVELPPP